MRCPRPLVLKTVRIVRRAVPAASTGNRCAANEPVVAADGPLRRAGILFALGVKTSIPTEYRGNPLPYSGHLPGLTTSTVTCLSICQQVMENHEHQQQNHQCNSAPN